MLNLALICHNHTFQSKIKPTTKFPETLAKQGIPGQNKEKQNNDKNTICVPQSEAFVQSRLANQSVVAYNPRLPAALATSVLTHGVWKILKLKF